MNEVELYEFDRQGYIIIEELLTPEEVGSLSAAIDALEEDALENVDKPPRQGFKRRGGHSHHRGLLERRPGV
jgi:hypothetical protein